MMITVREYGERPLLMTPARINAPQGARALADLLGEDEFINDFMDVCIIEVDWEGDGFTPILHIMMHKWFIKGNREADIDWKIDLEDAFGQDNMDNGILRQIVYDIGQLIHQKEEERNRS